MNTKWLLKQIILWFLAIWALSASLRLVIELGVSLVYWEALAAPEPYFEPVPRVLLRIGSCESSTGHFEPDGTVVRGRENPLDVGKYQINLFYHEESASEMGLDLFDEADNEKYAVFLYKTQGTDPWNASRACWESE